MSLIFSSPFALAAEGQTQVDLYKSANAAKRAGYEGIIFQSAHSDEGVNIVLFVDEVGASVMP